MTNPWSFDPMVPLTLHHSFTLMPGWTITPELKATFTPFAFPGAVPVVASAATVTMTWSF